MNIRLREAADHAAARAFLARHDSLGGPSGRTGPSPGLSGFCRRDPGRADAGHAYLRAAQDWRECEILTLHASEQWHGTGTALVGVAGQLARRQRCSRLWVITTNDNVDALRFYQRRGFCLAGVHRGAVDRSRASLKPEIPAVGAYEIPMHDEIELEKQP